MYAVVYLDSFVNKYDQLSLSIVFSNAKWWPFPETKLNAILLKKSTDYLHYILLWWPLNDMGDSKIDTTSKCFIPGTEIRENNKNE